MGFFRELRFETKYLIEELFILLKHPTRKQTYHDIKYHWHKLMSCLFYHPWYCLKRGIRNLFVWFPIIWRNDVYDHYYLLDMIDKQMKEMENFFLSDETHLANAKLVGKRIAWTRKLQAMWRDEYYEMLEYDKHKLKFPEKGRLLDSEPYEYDEYGIVTLFKCKPQSQEVTDDFRYHMEIGRKMNEKCFNLWIKNLSRIREFWD